MGDLSPLDCCADGVKMMDLILSDGFSDSSADRLFLLGELLPSLGSLSLPMSVLVRGRDLLEDVAAGSGWKAGSSCFAGTGMLLLGPFEEGGLREKRPPIGPNVEGWDEMGGAGSGAFPTIFSSRDSLLMKFCFTLWSSILSF